MTMTADEPLSERQKRRVVTRRAAGRHARSSVTNGMGLFADKSVDGRTGWCRRLRDLIFLHVNEAGGEDMVSAAERSIIRRVATLTVELEILEARFALAGGAKPEDLMLYVTASNALRRLLEAIGLKRIARNVTPSRTLDDILAELDRETSPAVNAEDVK
jgi:hypothetical protein